jgi:hypothetical protein
VSRQRSQQFRRRLNEIRMGREDQSLTLSEILPELNRVQHPFYSAPLFSAFFLLFFFPLLFFVAQGLNPLNLFEQDISNPFTHAEAEKLLEELQAENKVYYTDDQILFI